jgi:hypothetical protein
VLPTATSAPVAAGVCSVAISIAVVDEVIAVVNIDVIVAATAPPGIVTPASAPHGSHGNSHAE